MHKLKGNILIWVSTILLFSLVVIGFYVFNFKGNEPEPFYWKISDKTSAYINEGGLIIGGVSYDMPVIKQEYTLYDKNSDKPVILPKGTILKSSLDNYSSEVVIENDNTPLTHSYPILYTEYEESLVIYTPDDKDYEIAFDWQGLETLEALKRVENSDIEKTQTMFKSDQIDLSFVQAMYYTLPNAIVKQVAVGNNYIILSAEDVQNGLAIFLKINDTWYVTGVEI